MNGRAIVAVGDGQVEVREVTVPPVGEWDILVEVERSAISAGTESHVVRSLASAGRPLVLGYAPVARVQAVGECASRYFAPGDRVTYFGPDRSVDGPVHGSGGHQSPAVLNVNPESRDLLGPDRYCVTVPSGGVSSDHVAFAGIAAVSSMGATMPRTMPGDRVLVLGQGLIGQFAAQHFRLRGADVVVSDIDERRLGISVSCGTAHVINTSREETVAAVRSVWPNGADIVADTTGSYRVIESTLDSLSTRGRYVFLGWCKGTDFALERFHRQKVFEAFFPWTLEGPHVQHSTRMILQGALRVEPMITHRVPVDDAPRVYQMILRSPADYLGVVFTWDEAPKGEQR